jgi:hypothetical protein
VSFFLFYFDVRFTDAAAAGASWNAFINLVVGGTFI